MVKKLISREKVNIPWLTQIPVRYQQDDVLQELTKVPPVSQVGEFLGLSSPMSEQIWLL